MTAIFTAVTRWPRPVAGLFRLPNAPSLGLDIDEAALAQRQVELPGS